MICVYEPNCTDFSTLGLGTLDPASCVVTHTLNGDYELELTHLIDDSGKWQRLKEGYILRAPVPSATTPILGVNRKNTSTTVSSVDIYKVNTSSGRLRLRAKASTSATVLGSYKKGTLVTVIAKTSSTWYEVNTADGKHGYMYASYLTFVKSTTTTTNVVTEVVKESDSLTRTLRDQPFRIYRVVPDLEKTTVYARHIFYDLMNNMVKKYVPGAKTQAKAVVQGISNACLSSHDFTFYSDMTGTYSDAANLEWLHKNPVDLLLGDDGFTDTYGGEIEMDWYDAYVCDRIGQDTDIYIREGKNLTGVSYDLDETDVVTRIMPVGEDADGNPLYLSGTQYIDSKYINNYPAPRWSVLEVSGAKVGQKNDDTGKTITAATARTLMKQAANDAFTNGCDLPDITLSVDFINLIDTPEAEKYHTLQNLYLGDTVKVRAPRVGVSVSMRVTQFEYNCLTKQYDKLVLGNVQDALDSTSITSRQISTGSITNSKLAAGSVTASTVGVGAISATHIAAESISTEKLIANAVTAEKLAAGAVTADKLDATTVSAAYAHITNGEIDNAEIDAAKIKNMDASYAHITEGVIDNATIDVAKVNDLSTAYAHITNGEIDNAEIDAAKIKNMDASYAHITDGLIDNADITWADIQTATADQLISHDAIGDRYYIDKLQVSNAQMVEATVGTLVIKASDGKYYQLDVDTDTYSLTTTEVSPTDSEISAGETESGRSIIDTSITAADLAATNLKAINALVDKITAERIDADKLFARQAVIDAITTSQIISENLNVTASKILIGYDESGEEVWSTVSDNIDDTSEKITEAKSSIESLNGDQDKLEGRVTTNENDITTYKTWVEINSDTETVYVGSSEQAYRARVDSHGFHIDQKDVDEYNEISAFIENTLTVEKIQLGRVLDSAPEEGDTRITMKPSSDGGLMWVPEAIKGYVKK